MSENRKAIQQFILIISLLINLISISLFNSSPGLHLIVLYVVIPFYLILGISFRLIGSGTSNKIKSHEMGLQLISLGVLQSWPVFILDFSVPKAMYFGLLCSVLSLILLIVLIKNHHKKFIVTK